MVDLSELGTLAPNTAEFPPIVALTEVVPEWAASASLEDVARWLHGEDTVVPSVVLVDGMLLAQQGDGWLEDIERLVGPVVTVTDEPGSGPVADRRRRVPRSLLHAPVDVARTVIEDLARDQEDLARDQEVKPAPKDPLCAEGLERYMRDAIHEFRTPLTVISEFAGLCEDGIGGPLTERQVSYLGYIMDAVERMGHQFDDFRDGLRMHLGTLEHGSDEAPVIDSVRSALKSMDVDLEESSFGAVHGRKVQLDASRLPVALRRVVAGARKLSATGERVAVSAREGNTADTVEVVVAYVGVELSQDDVVVMGRGTSMRGDGFYRSVSRVFGLGVSMARMFLLQSGGQIFLETHGSGGAFVLILPLSPPQP